MSIERAMIAQAQPRMAAGRAKAVLRGEISKGCRPHVSPRPVGLEPRFFPLWDVNGDSDRCDQAELLYEEPASSKDLVRFKVWIDPNYKLSWNLSELLVKQLQLIKHRCVFEISGNRDKIGVSFTVHRDDRHIFKAAFEGEHDLCELDQSGKATNLFTSGSAAGKILFRDIFPIPPYSHLLTRPQELQSSPLKSLVIALSDIKPDCKGLFQIIFQPVSPEHNWHRNIQILLDVEYNVKLLDGFHQPHRYAQQSPSGDLRQMSMEVESKAHNDKPLYAMAFRLATISGGGRAPAYLEAISSFTGLFLHGGRPLRTVTENQYGAVISPDQIRDMFLWGVTYRPGFLVNSQELCGLVHIPEHGVEEKRSLPLDLLTTLPIQNSDLFSGTFIGVAEYAGTSNRVCLPGGLRKKHTHLIGRSGVGKSTTQEHMILCDIEQGDGVAVLDPHGDLVERVLHLISERHIERIIYFDPGDPEWIPIWNPLQPIEGQDIGRTADDIVQAIQSFISKTGWGDRLEHLLRNMIFSLMHLPKGTFLDISNMLRNKSDESKLLCRKILEVVDNETVRQFWRHDYQKYGKDDLGPPRNKLSKLLVSNSVSLMLSQPESLFNFRQIMDCGMILLVNLSNIGSMVRGILGSFILSLLHLTALSRSSTSQENRKQFHIHCDEAHRFMTDSLEDLIAETRKYKVSLSLAHQYLSQFGKRKTDAFSSVGSTIIFNVDSRDAAYLAKDLQQKVKVEDLVSLEVGETIARIGTEIVKFKTRPPLPIPEKSVREEIVQHSRNKYCRPAQEVRKIIKKRMKRWNEPFEPLCPPVLKDGSPVKEFEYDEF